MAPRAKAEKRMDPDDGVKYTEDQFVEFYGAKKGAKKWAVAEPKAAATKPKAKLEKRMDPDEGVKYTEDEFLEFYGAKKGAKKWAAAAPKVAAAKPKAKAKAKAKAKKAESSEKTPRGPRTIWTFALTGGPCGGKGSCQPFLKEKLKEKGYDVYTVPEVPTIFFVQGGGCVTFPGLDAGDKLIQFETAIIKMQLQIEDSFKLMARTSGKPSIILCDRGIMDIAAYLPGGTGGDAWKSIMKANRLVEVKMLSRYAGVLHLQTAANGAEQFYKHGNTKDDAGKDVFRSETPEQARELDEKVLACWEKHKHLSTIKNLPGATMQDKCQKCLEAVLAVVERPAEPAASSEATA